ncbi:MAG: hypothetical protein MH213_06090 [Marinobacter sp.]|nr:hypothetical protein [Marinobacter sp.]
MLLGLGAVVGRRATAAEPA